MLTLPCQELKKPGQDPMMTPNDPAMITVRIANAWSDLPAAQALADRLTKEGMTARLVCCGTDDEAQAPQRHAGPATVTLALWSPAATTSLWVLKETDAAAAAGTLVEALLAPPRPPQAQGRPAPIDLRNWNPATTPPSWRALCRRIVLVAAGKSQNRSALAILGPAALGIAGGAYMLFALGQNPSGDAGPAEIATNTLQTETQAAANFTPQAAPNDPQLPEASGIGGPLIAVAQNQPAAPPERRIAPVQLNEPPAPQTDAAITPPEQPATKSKPPKPPSST
jgi:hypothetical protein